MTYCIVIYMKLYECNLINIKVQVYIGERDSIDVTKLSHIITMTSPQVALNAPQSWWLFPAPFKTYHDNILVSSRCNCSPAQGAMPMTCQECLLFFFNYVFSQVCSVFFKGVFARKYVVCQNRQVSLCEIKLYEQTPSISEAAKVWQRCASFDPH